MKLADLKLYFTEKLGSIYPTTEIETFFFWIIEEVLKIKRIDYVFQKSNELLENDFEVINSILERLLAQEPIQYIFGKTDFFGLPFKVSKATLIPRPETEELIEWILETIHSNSALSSIHGLKILDIGTGSGCIAISLAKKLTHAQISAFDISKEALAVAKENAIQNEVTIDFLEVNILDLDYLEEEFDIIVSNPPYVRNSEKIEIKNNVLLYEPKTALFVKDEQPLLFYDKISNLAREALNPNGFLFFEINQYLGNETIDLLHKNGFISTVLRKDLFGNDRMIKCQLT